MIAPRDESSHASGRERLWNESHYFNFFDPRSRLGGFTRIGTSPNVGLRDQILCLFLPGAPLAIVRDAVPVAGNPTEVRAGGLRYECASPLAEWRIVYQGPLHLVAEPGLLRDPLTLPLRPFETAHASIDLTFRGANRAVDYHGGAMRRGLAPDPIEPFRRLRGKALGLEAVKLLPRLASLPRMGRAHHYEQTGSYEGTVRVGRRRWRFGGTGQRDHSWGVRDWRVPARWCWFTGQFGAGDGLVAFNACFVDVLLFRARGGYVYEGGENHPLDRLAARTEFEPDGLTPRSVKLFLAYGRGRALEIEGRIERVAPIAFANGLHRVLVNEAMAEYACGTRRCHGIAEYLFQL